MQKKKADAQGSLRRAGGAARPCPLGRGGVLCPLSSPVGPCERREQRERCEDARRWNNEFIAACHPAKAISTIRHCKLLLKGERASPHHHSHPGRPAPNQMGEGGREREKEGACSRKRKSGTEERTRRGGRRDRGRVCFGVSVRAGPRLGVWKPGVPLAAFKATAALGWSCLFHNQWGVLGLPPFQKGCWSSYLTSFKSLLTSLPFLLFFCLGRKFLPQVFLRSWPRGSCSFISHLKSLQAPVRPHTLRCRGSLQLSWFPGASSLSISVLSSAFGCSPGSGCRTPGD